VSPQSVLLAVGGGGSGGADSGSSGGSVGAGAGVGSSNSRSRSVSPASASAAATPSSSTAAATATATEAQLRRAVSRAPDAVPDIEDVASVMQLGRGSANLPLMVEVVLFEGGQFRSAQQLLRDAHKLRKTFPPDHMFIVRANAGLATDMEALASKARFLASKLPQCPMWLDCSMSRLLALCSLRDSPFLKGSIYPALQVVVEPGEERPVLEGLHRVLADVQQFSGIQIMVEIVVDEPFPALADLLELLRSQSDLVRMILIKLERSPRRLRESLANSADPSLAGSVDVVALMRLIEFETGGTVAASDFMPLSAAQLFEPFLQAMGFGAYALRMDPLCLQATALVNTDRFRSLPVTRILDVRRLHRELRPVLGRIARTRKPPNLFALNRVRKAVQRCQRTELDLPDPVSYLISKEKRAAMDAFLHRVQLLIIHNTMDLGAVDGVRRCTCGVLKLAPTASGFAASCTMCL